MLEKKSKGTTQCDKRTVICNVGTSQCEDRIVKCEKKVRGPPNVTKEVSYVMLELYNVRMKPLNVRKKIREPSNVTKELSYVMLELHNMMIKSLNVKFW